MFYHASPVHCIEVLEPRVSNHGKPLVYLSKKRENVLPYLSNAIEKYCKETGFPLEGTMRKWGSYGFYNGLVRMDEYWPGALEYTYKGVPGYIYAAGEVPGMEELPDIPDAVITSEAVPVLGCEYVPDAYEAILTAAGEGRILIRRYEELPEKTLAWIDSCIKEQYEEARDIPTYRHFLRGKFPEITAGLE